MNQRVTSAQPAQPPRGGERSLTREEQAAENARAMPAVAAIVAEYRRVFGPEVKLRWAREGEREVGRKDWMARPNERGR